MDNTNAEWYSNNNGELEKFNSIEIINENKFNEQFVYVRIQLGIPLIGENDKILDSLKKINEQVSPIWKYELSSNIFLWDIDNYYYYYYFEIIILLLK